MRMTQTRNYLGLSGIRKCFDQFVALDQIDLSIREGEFVCFLGPSGCGKTTLLRIIAGLEQQDAGEIWQAGCNISQLPPEQRDFGIVFQSYALFPNLSVTKNIAYGLQGKKLTRSQVQSRVEGLLDTVGLPDAGHKYPAQLSGGQQQRVALARALATEPGLLLLDEPLSALDARVRASLREEIKRMQRELGITTIMVTHDQEEALSMADRVVVMNQGCIEQVGTPNDVYLEPSTPFVADFVGVMNFLPGTLVRSDELLLAGRPICCPAEHGLETDTPVNLAIRPEEVELVPVGYDAMLSAELESVEFQGGLVRSRLRLEGSEDRVMVDLNSRQQSTLNLQPGTWMGVKLPSQHIRLFAA